MCGMSAAFSAVFGTPMAAAVFSMEVVSVGVMYYAALLPCVISSLVAAKFAAGYGIHPESFHVSGIPDLTAVTGAKMLLVAVGCGIISILFCITLKSMGSFYKRFFKNPYLRIIAASVAIILITVILQTPDYMGAGNELIALAVRGQARSSDFLWKLLLTAVTMKAGFRGEKLFPPSVLKGLPSAVSWDSFWACRLHFAQLPEWLLYSVALPTALLPLC